MKKQIFYELNARQFSDRTNSGVGDFAGLSTKIDYFEFLGVDSIIFQNILAINDVDKIQNYTSITKSLGDINEFKRVISLLKGKGVKAIIELGIGTIRENHKWFQYAIDQAQEDFKSIVNFRPTDEHASEKDILKYSPENKSYYVIDEKTKEVPLNWLSDQVIERFIKIVKFWNEIGVDGFVFKGFEYLADEAREDKMNDDTMKQLRKFYRAIKEINDEIMVIGRSDEVELGESLSLTKNETKVFDYFISDQFYKIGSSPKYGQDAIGKFKPKKLGKMLKEYANDPSQVIAFAHPKTGRVNSRWGLNAQYQYQSAKTISLALLLTTSSALIYYSDELGVFNIGLTHLDDFQDDSLEARKRRLENMGLNNRDFMAAQVLQNPINSRSLMPWNSEKNGGFSYEDRTITPVNIDYKEVNVEMQYKDTSSPLQFYKKMIDSFSSKLSKEEHNQYKETFNISVQYNGIIKYSFSFSNKNFSVFINISKKLKKINSPRFGAVVAQTYFHKTYAVPPVTLGAYESIVIEEVTPEQLKKNIELNTNKEVELFKEVLVKELDKKHENVVKHLTDELHQAQDNAEAKKKEFQQARDERIALEEKRKGILEGIITKAEAEELIFEVKKNASDKELKDLEKTTSVKIVEIDEQQKAILKSIEIENEKIKNLKTKAKIEMEEKMKAAEDAIFKELGDYKSALKESDIALTTVIDDDELDFG